MEEIKLDVLVRNQVGSQKVKNVRRDDFVPGVVYGGGDQATPIKIDRRVFEKIRRQHHGEIVFHLNLLEGEKKLLDYSAIVKEEQHDPVTDKIVHIDFKKISLKEKIEVEVPIVTKGEAVGVKQGGSVDHILWELDIICLPTDIPENIVIDISNMQIGDSIHLRDVKLPEGITTKHDLDAIVLSIAAPMREEEIEAKPAEGEPEVIKEKKEPAATKEAAEEEK